MKMQTITRTRQNARAADAMKQSTQKSTTRGRRCGSSDGEGSAMSSPPSSGGSGDNSPNSCFGDLSSLIDHHVAVIHTNLNKGQKRQRLKQKGQNLQEVSTASMNTSDIPSSEHDGEESGIPPKHSRRTRSTAASGGVHQKQSSKNNDNSNSNSNITTRNVENSDNVTGRSNMDQLYLQFMSKANRHSSGGEKTTEPGSSAQRKPYDLRMRNTARFQEGCVEDPEVIAQEPEMTGKELQVLGTLGGTVTHGGFTNQNMAGTSLSNDVIQRNVTEQDVEACVEKLLQVFAQYDRISEETSRLKERAEHQFLVTL